MSEYVDFHYMPLEGRITGNQVLKQTEDAINDLGNKVYNIEIDDEKIQQAIDDSQEALDIAGEALATVTTNRAVWFNSVAELRSANIETGITAATRGEDVFNDGSGAFYAVRTKKGGDTDSDDTVFLNNGNVAERIQQFNFVAKGNNVIYVANVAELKSSNAVIDNAYGTVGYYLANDGGSALYNIRAKVPGDVDDGGSIIFLDNGNVAELITDGTVCPEQFGAYGDGVHDDTDAINLAIAKGSIIICNKKYYIGNNKIVSFNYLENKILIGGEFVFAPSQTLQNAIDIKYANNITVSSIKLSSTNTYPSVDLDGFTNWNSSVSSNRAAFAVYGSYNIKIQNIISENMYSDVHVNGDGTHYNDHIVVDVYNATGSVRTNFFVQRCGHYTLKNVYCKPANLPIPGVHFLYVAGYNEHINIKNVEYVGTTYNNSILNLYCNNADLSDNPDIYIDIDNCIATGANPISVNQKKATVKIRNSVFNNIKVTTQNDYAMVSAINIGKALNGSITLENCSIKEESNDGGTMFSYANDSAVHTLDIIFKGCSFENFSSFISTKNNFKRLKAVNCYIGVLNRMCQEQGTNDWEIIYDNCELSAQDNYGVSLVGTGNNTLIIKDCIINSNSTNAILRTTGANSYVKAYNTIINNANNPTLKTGNVTLYNVVYNGTVQS